MSGELYLTRTGDAVDAFRISDGRFAWRFTPVGGGTDAAIHGPPALTDGKVAYLLKGTELIQIDVATGRSLDRRSLPRCSGGLWLRTLRHGVLHVDGCQKAFLIG